MDYEKAYTNAVARAKQAIKDCGHNEGRKRMIEDIFPELDDPDRIRQELIQYLQNKPYPPSGRYSVTDFLNWLEKQGEQKPAWSKEDEGELYLTISLLDKFKEEAYTNDCENCINWLKSLKPQPHWKPTEEQMQTLEETIEYNAADANVVVLRSLINDLKKL